MSEHIKVKRDSPVNLKPGFDCVITKYTQNIRMKNKWMLDFLSQLFPSHAYKAFRNSTAISFPAKCFVICHFKANPSLESL